MDSDLLAALLAALDEHTSALREMTAAIAANTAALEAQTEKDDPVVLMDE